MRKMNNEIRLNQELYTEAVIRQAVRDYGALAKIELDSENGYFICRFLWTKPQLQLTMKEFQNYVTGLTGKYEYR